jgi:hypothetical protein
MSTVGMTATCAAPQTSSRSVPEFRADRNLAVDAMRVVAMCLVAVGHWLAADVRVGTDGVIRGGNALDALATMHWLTWFFFVGGYSNAASLASAHRRGTTTPSWIRARLARLVQPTAVLCATWMTIVGLASLLGDAASSTAVRASKLAVIPLWFLAVYVVDIALAPLVSRLVARLGRATLLLPVAVIALDVVRRSGFSAAFVPQVLFGWTCFQAAGMAWFHGRIRRSVATTLMPLCLIGAIAGVVLGPWPVSLVSVPGAELGNTWPPSPVLIGYGFAQCMLAVVAAPFIDTLLRRRRRVALVVGAAGLRAMSVYLWHLTAMTIVGVAAATVGLLRSDVVGSTAWFIQKGVLIGASIPVLLGLVALFGRAESMSETAPSASVGGPRRSTTAALVVALAVAFEFVTVNGLSNLKGFIGMSVVIGSAVFLTGRSRVRVSA